MSRTAIVALVLYVIIWYNMGYVTGEQVRLPLLFHAGRGWCFMMTTYEALMLILALISDIIAFLDFCFNLRKK